MLKHVITAKTSHKGTNTEDDHPSTSSEDSLYSKSTITCNCAMIRIVIDRTRCKPLGIKVVGGRRLGRGVFVSSILESGAIYANGEIKEGDEILAINDYPLGKTTTLEHTLMIIRKIKTAYVIMHVARRVSQSIDQ